MAECACLQGKEEIWCVSIYIHSVDGSTRRSSWKIQNLIKSHAGWMVPGGEGLPSVTGVAHQDAVHAAKANTAWLEDCSARLLCVLALDRFGDYVSDKVYSTRLATPGSCI